MLKNYLKVIIQNLLRNRVYAMINVLGLAIGLAVCLFIIQYVRFEESFDHFHPDYQNKYRAVLSFSRTGDELSVDAANYAPAGPTMEAEFPEVVRYTRITPEYSRVVLGNGETLFETEKVYYVDSTFFSFFGYRLLEGTPTNVLNDVNTIVLSLSEAEKLFGPRSSWRDTPVGKTIVMNSRENLLVTGIMEDFPVNSHFQAKAVISWLTFIKENDPSEMWGWNDFYTYIQLRDGTDYKSFESKLAGMLSKHKPEGNKDRMILQPLADIHLHSNVGFELTPNGNAQTVYFLSIIAIVILLIAWVNYINLATARSENRMKEIGVRKVTGATRREIISQFMLESFLMNAASLLVALAIVSTTFPLVSRLVNRPLAPPSIQDHAIWVYIFIMHIVGSIVSGFYPAWVLSSFKTVSIFKSTSFAVTRGKSVLRQSLVIFQFMLSVGLITGTLMIRNQLRYMQSKDLGFSYENTLVINAPSTLPSDSILLLRYESFRHKVLGDPGIEKVAMASALPGKSYNDLDTHGYCRMATDPSDVNIALSSFRVMPEFFDLMDIKFLAGHNFTPEQVNRTDMVILNRNAAEVFGFNDPSDIIGKKIITNGNQNEPREVIGVIENYHHKSLRNRFEPTMIRGDIFHMLYFVLKLSPRADIHNVVADVNAEWKNFFPGDPFDYSFLDEHVARQYQADVQFSKLFSVFSGFSIFIACLGLFGLISYSISVRVKEIGIRKVLGASVSGIVLLFTRSYARLLILAYVAGLPLSYYILSAWTNSFAYRASISSWIFIIPVIAVTLLAFITMSVQIIRAALINPSDCLRQE